LLLLGIIINHAPVIQADSISNNDIHFASTLAIRYTSRYKFDYGKLYKRTYDTTHKQFVGDWILVQ
ncbi:hypothetical protein MMJ21_11215, partial [Enterococcus cecorum]|uniref:hypothetical protein n=1 Tax=Enterococcus cecorum TaxID=44008 RepID=UPI001FAB9862